VAMPGVGGIERPTQQADAHPAPVAEAGDRFSHVPFGLLGRSCPGCEPEQSAPTVPRRKRIFTTESTKNHEGARSRTAWRFARTMRLETAMVEIYWQGAAADTAAIR
jgi:hypothetical protein